MNLVLQREPSSPQATIGKLYCGDELLCDTLEDVVRQPAGEDAPDAEAVARWKVKGETAIPTGRFRVMVTPSQRFGRMLPLLVGVPGFDGVRIHPGNTAADTEGCILPGQRMGPATIVESRKAFARVYQTILDAIAAGEEIWIDVRNP